MSTIVHDREAALAMQQLPYAGTLSPLCVKERNKSIPEVKYGYLHTPSIPLYAVSSDADLMIALREWGERNKGEHVVVVGHCICPGDDFIWRGTPQEFAKEWQGD